MDVYINKFLISSLLERNFTTYIYSYFHPFIFIQYLYMLDYCTTFYSILYCISIWYLLLGHVILCVYIQYVKYIFL